MPEDRQMAIDLIAEACAAGARQARACAVLEIDVRTLRRWQSLQRDEQRLVDRRREAADRIPANKLSPEERERILAVCNAPAYRSLPPSQIVPRLADEGEYLASESTFYRVLREDGQQNRRGRALAPRQVPKPQGFKAEGPNQVYSWDITYLAAAIRGVFYRLYPVFVNEVARFFHATFFFAVPSDSLSCGGFSQTSLIGVQLRVSPDQRSGRACLAAS